MQLISNKAKKLLKDLDNPKLWRDTYACVQNKKEGFEVWSSTTWRNKIIWRTDVEFNLIERILICRKVRKLKDLFSKPKKDCKIIPKYFK